VVLHQNVQVIGIVQLRWEDTDTRQVLESAQTAREIRDKLIQYQRECYLVLADAFLQRSVPERSVPDDWGQTDPETIMALQQIRNNALAASLAAS
jgi:hypothetical protein